MMLYPDQNRLVVEFLTTKSKWPKVGPRLWAYMIEFHCRETNEVLLTREGMIDRVKASPRAVDGVLGELVRFHALTTLRVPTVGRQGRGVVQYFLNPRVGSEYPEGKRDAERARAPKLGLVASAVPTERRSRAALPAPVVS